MTGSFVQGTITANTQEIFPRNSGADVSELLKKI